MWTFLRLRTWPVSEPRMGNTNRNKLGLLYLTQETAVNKLYCKTVMFTSFFLCVRLEVLHVVGTWLARAVKHSSWIYTHALLQIIPRKYESKWLVLVNAIAHRKLKCHVLLLTLHRPTMYLHSDMTQLNLSFPATTVALENVFKKRRIFRTK